MVDKTNYENNIDALSKIELIKSQLDEGSSFEDLVAEYSEDIVTKDQGGNLDYFEEDVFPEEFGSALKDMQNSDISSIIEIDSSYHILKVTEVLEEKIKSFDEISSEIIEELISAESLALLNDDFNELDQLSLEGSTINDLAAFASKEIQSSSLQSISSINTEYDALISDIVFDDSIELNTPKVVDLDGTIYVISLSEIKEPELKPFALVQEEVNSSLIEINASIRRAELEKEYLNLSLDSEKKTFVEDNLFVSSESFKDIKRYSSLLPQDILRNLFESNPGSELSLSSINGDHYFITLNAYTYPTDIEKQEVVDQYTPFDTERLADRMNDIMNDDLFDTAKIDLNEQIFTRSNQMKKFHILPIICSLFFIYSCSENISPVDSGLEDKIFHFGNGTEPQGIDPHIVTGVPEHHLLIGLCEGLTTANPKGGSSIAGAAESWDISEDGKTYTFYLQKNGRWSNGDQLTAHDFVWS